MALQFPSTTGQPTDGSFTYTQSGNVWAWDGVRWNPKRNFESMASNIDTSNMTDGSTLIFNSETDTWEAKVDTSAIAFAIALS